MFLIRKNLESITSELSHFLFLVNLCGNLSIQNNFDYSHATKSYILSSSIE